MSQRIRLLRILELLSIWVGLLPKRCLLPKRNYLLWGQLLPNRHHLLRWRMLSNRDNL